MVFHFQYSNVPIIICEGDSEANYLNILNRIVGRITYLSEQRKECYLSAVCKSISADSGRYSSIIKAYKKALKENPKSEFHIWVDQDIYTRGRCMDPTESPKSKGGLPGFWFSKMNFEDFMMLHKDIEVLNNYVDELAALNHFVKPLVGSEHEKIFKVYNPGYKKGNLPFELNKKTVEQMFNNLTVTKIRCDFGEWLRQEIDKGRLIFREDFDAF